MLWVLNVTFWYGLWKQISSIEDNKEWIWIYEYDILEKLAEEIFQYTAYPQNHQTDDVAEAFIKKFPYGWMISLKYKMANYRMKMQTIGFPEVTVNALKNKHSDVKKPKKAVVNFCPSHPAGETDESLENVRLELLNDVRQRNKVHRV